MALKSFRLAGRLVGQGKLIYRLYRDPASPKLFKVLVWAIPLYIIIPLDLIPDLQPLLGQLDDLAVIVLGMKFLTRLCPKELVEKHRKEL